MQIVGMNEMVKNHVNHVTYRAIHDSTIEREKKNICVVWSEIDQKFLFDIQTLLKNVPF
jgi:hypothetical protein